MSTINSGSGHLFNGSIVTVTSNLPGSPPVTVTDLSSLVGPGIDAMGPIPNLEINNGFYS